MNNRNKQMRLSVLFTFSAIRQGEERLKGFFFVLFFVASPMSTGALLRQQIAL